MTGLDLLWWVGWAWFASWAALPLALTPFIGTAAGLVAWAVLTPFTSLLGMTLLHRLLPASDPGTFQLFADRGSMRWAMKGWAPSVYLTVFQPIMFQSTGFQRLTLRAFGARMAPGALMTSRTIVREPHHVQLGASTLVGEFVHLICSYQPRPGLLVVDRIEIGDHVLVGAYSHVGPGVRIGPRCLLEYAVRVGAHTTVGEGTRIGAGTSIYNSVRIGAGVSIGKGCLIPSGAVIPNGARVPDGTVVHAMPSTLPGPRSAT